MNFMGVDYTNASATAIIEAILKPYGLGGVAGRMYQVGKDTGNADAAYLWLREQPEYKAAFPAMAVRQQNGYAPINEATYMEYKTTMKSVMRNNGIDPGFYDGEDDFTAFIGNNISPSEVEDRVTKGVLAAKQAPQEVKDALFQYYGITDGQLAAYWLDPKKSLDLLNRQAATSQIGGAADFGGFGDISRTEAEKIQGRGISAEQAQERFGTLGSAKELMGTLAGEASSDISREQQLQYVEGSQQAQQAIQKKAAQRKAQFAGGGSFAAGERGVTGLGSGS